MNIAAIATDGNIKVRIIHYIDPEAYFLCVTENGKIYRVPRHDLKITDPAYLPTNSALAG